MQGVSQWKNEGVKYGHWDYFREETINEILEIIEANKEGVRKDTGAFKYDFCFDLIKEAIKKQFTGTDKGTDI